MTLVVDASVALLWVLPQEQSPRAAAIRAEQSLIAPALISSEIGSGLWKAARRVDITTAEALAALKIVLNHFERLIPDDELRDRALELAIELDHPVYDCFYLALAERERCPMVTADKRLLTATKKFKRAEIRAL